MLVLTIKPKDWIVLTLPDGRRVRICVRPGTFDSWRLAFDAPPDVLINRGEVQDRIDAGVPPPVKPNGRN